MCLWLCTTSVHNTTQNSSDNLPSYVQTTDIALMLSIEGEEVCKDQDWKWDGTPLVSSKPYLRFFQRNTIPVCHRADMDNTACINVPSRAAWFSTQNAPETVLGDPLGSSQRSARLPSWIWRTEHPGQERDTKERKRNEGIRGRGTRRWNETRFHTGTFPTSSHGKGLLRTNYSRALLPCTLLSVNLTL